MADRSVLVVGATGGVGRKVVAELLAAGRPVRALVRPGSDATALEQAGVAIHRGDMLDPGSLRTAFEGADAVISSAAGYMRRRKTDTPEIDTVGNRNLAVAARDAGVRRFVLCSILNCHEVPKAEHFWHKKLAEDALAELGVPFVSLRPGAFLDQSVDMFANFVRRRRFLSLGDPKVRSTYVYTPDLARYLARAVDAPAAEGERVDIGWDRPVGSAELAAIASGLVGEPIGVRPIPRWLIDGALSAFGLLNPGVRDFHTMFRYIWSGRYVADTRRQAELFGPPPTAEDAVGRWLGAMGLLPAPVRS